MVHRATTRGPPWPRFGVCRLQAVDVIATCLGQEGALAASAPLVLFLSAAFFLLLGLGRLGTLARLVARLARGEELTRPTEDVLGYEVSAAERRFAVTVTAIAFLYVPAALALGAGLTAEVIVSHGSPVTLGLELAGLTLAFATMLLLFLANRLARDPRISGGLSHSFNDHPVLSTNAALLNRGTNRFEVVLVILLAVTVGGWQWAGSCFGPLLSASLASANCPPADHATAITPPAFDFARLPARNDPGAIPALRLEQDSERDPGLAFGAQALLDAAPRAEAPAPSVWLQMAALTFPHSADREYRIVQSAINLVRPALRPTYLFPPGRAVPPPNLFGTVAQQTRMAPAVWQVRVHSGYSDFGRCLEERGDCTPNAGRWADFVSATRGLEGLALYGAVNEFVNTSVRFQADSTLEDVLDDWVTPVSLISTAQGDCEDFALAKFWLLEALGVDRSDLYIVVVQDLVVQLPHAFLAVRDGDDVWLLDSRTNRPLSPDDVEGIVPVITIGDSAAYLHGRPMEPVEETPMSWLMRWLPFS